MVGEIKAREILGASILEDTGNRRMEDWSGVKEKRRFVVCRRKRPRGGS